MTFNLISNKRQTVIKLLQKVDERRAYTLYIATCYFTPKQIEKFVDEITSKINIHQIYIYLDKRSAIQHGCQELADMSLKLGKKSKTSVFISKKSNLFHTKGYALVAYDKDDEIASASLVIGSANCTENGFSNKTGNFESLLSTTNTEDVEKFIASLDKIGFHDLNKLDEFTDIHDPAFQYALIMMGNFYAQWEDTLEKYFRVTFNLSEKGKQEYKTQNSTLTNNGFSLVAATIGKQYFDFKHIKLSEQSDVDLKNSIKTRFGKWIPRNITNEIFSEEQEFLNFKLMLEEAIALQKDDAIEKLIADYNNLFDEGLINPIDDFNKHTNTITKKLSRLNDTNSESILERIFYQIVQFDFPYDIKESDNIHEVFYEMYDMCISRARKNKTQKAFLHAIDEISLDPIINLPEIQDS